VTQAEQELWLANNQLRQQAHYYQSLHARALAKPQDRRTCDYPGVPDGIVAAPPARLIPKGLLSAGTLVEMLRLKYKDHLPLPRILGLPGLGLKVQTS